jgi:hypothetical protein
MNLFKLIQHMVLASLVMTVAMPTATLAMARNQRSAQQVRHTVAPYQSENKTMWSRIKENWQYIAFGGCVLACATILVFDTRVRAQNNMQEQPYRAPRARVEQFTDEELVREFGVRLERHLDNVINAIPFERRAELTPEEQREFDRLVAHLRQTVAQMRQQMNNQ